MFSSDVHQFWIAICNSDVSSNQNFWSVQWLDISHTDDQGSIQYKVLETTAEIWRDVVISNITMYMTKQNHLWVLAQSVVDKLLRFVRDTEDVPEQNQAPAVYSNCSFADCVTEDHIAKLRTVTLQGQDKVRVVVFLYKLC